MVLTIILIASAVIIISPIASTLISVAFRFEVGTTHRTEIWANTIEMIRQNFWLGIGIGNYTETYDQYFALVYWRNIFGGGIDHAHNQFLSKTAELGIGGLLVMLYLYYFPIKHSIRIFKRPLSREMKIIAVGAICGVIGMYVRSIFEASGMLTEGALYPDMIFWILIVFILKIESLNSNIDNNLPSVS